MSRRAWVEQVMGMPVSIHLRGPEVRGAEAERSVTSAYAELVRLDAVFSTYRPDSDISRRRRGESVPGAEDPLLAEVEELCRIATERTGGAFTDLAPPTPTAWCGTTRPGW